MSSIKQTKHLTARAGFGMTFEDFKADENTTAKQAVKELFKASEDDQPLDIVKVNAVYSMMMQTDVNARKQFMQQQRQEERTLNLAWTHQMRATRAQLREKMTLFWNNHFACRSNNAFFTQQLNNIQRTNALGNFRTMTLAISKS